MIYRLYASAESSTPNAATTVDSVPGWSFLFDPEQPLYQQFKTDVLAGAELQDADGNVMTQEEATAFIGTLP